MALTKTGYDSVKGSTKAKVNVNSDGHIALTGETVAGSKYVSFKNVNTDNNLAKNVIIFNAFLANFFGAATDDETNQMSVTWGDADTSTI